MMTHARPSLSSIRRLFVLVLFTFAALAIAMPSANAFSAEVAVYRPGCGYNYVASGGNTQAASARTTKGSHSCTGDMLAGLKRNGTTYWAQRAGEAVITGGSSDLIGYHKGCSTCNITTS